MISPEKQEVLKIFAQGRRLYKLLDFAGAMEQFEKACRLDPSDGPSRVYYARCKHYLQKPPPEDWDGVFVMQTK
ncbi:MAG: tetratricopeptide repeat protein [Spirochaetales bacterium]|jgi:Flp pilus assembly protein TadD|nr:tetratricopeptide repeat protein [Spirochaetales bacterium]